MTSNEKRGNFRQARALSRMFDKTSDEFVTNFAQTGVDEGPQSAADGSAPAASPPPGSAPASSAASSLSSSSSSSSSLEKPEAARPAPMVVNSEALADEPPQSELARQVREKSLRARDEREHGEAAPAFRGFATLLQSAGSAGSFSRALDESPADPANAAAGNVIKVKDTVGKKGGLYTSCFKKPVFPDEVAETKQSDTKSSETPAGTAKKEATGAKLAPRPIEKVETESKWSAQPATKAAPESKLAPLPVEKAETESSKWSARSAEKSAANSANLPPRPVAEAPQKAAAPVVKVPPTPDYSAFSRSSIFLPEPESVPVEPSFEKPKVPTVDIVKSASRPALELNTPAVDNLGNCGDSCQADREGGAFTRALKKLPEGESSPGSKSAWAEAMARKQRQDATEKNFSSLRGCHEAKDSCCPLSGVLSKVFSFFGNLFKGGKK